MVNVLLEGFENDVPSKEMNSKTLLKQVAVVTGASSGIGKAAAIRLAQDGYHLVLSGRSLEALEATKKACVAQGVPADYVTSVSGCLQEAEVAQKIVDTAVKNYGQINTLINSAGILTIGRVEDAPMDVYDKQFDTNVRSLVQITRLAIPYLKKTKGSIVNISSILGQVQLPEITYYCMTKSAVDQFTKCLALELAAEGVRVNAVCPGVIKTDLHQRAGVSDDKYEKAMEEFKKQHAMDRLGELHEAAEAIHFLATSRSSFTTGHLLNVDGGFAIQRPR